MVDFHVKDLLQYQDTTPNPPNSIDLPDKKRKNRRKQRRWSSIREKSKMEDISQHYLCCFLSRGKDKGFGHEHFSNCIREFVAHGDAAFVATDIL
jgi:hypothetical protein